MALFREKKLKLLIIPKNWIFFQPSVKYLYSGSHKTADKKTTFFYLKTQPLSDVHRPSFQGLYSSYAGN